MVTVVIWNSSSPNYRQNNFVVSNGTDTFQAKTEREAISLIPHAINNTDVERVEITLDSGKIFWVRNEGPCVCGRCNECVEQLEEFRRDSERGDTDMNGGSNAI